MAAAAFYDLEGTLVSTNLVHTLGFYARNQTNLLRSFTKSAATLLSVPLFAVSDQYSRKVFNDLFFKRYKGVTEDRMRFFADESVGYRYPEMYIKLFGDDYKPEPYIVAEYERARNHKWYMTSRLITVNDLYAFDPSVQVELEEFTDDIAERANEYAPPVWGRAGDISAIESPFLRMRLSVASSSSISAASSATPAMKATGALAPTRIR